ncbi:hypothetical protein L083_2523 [Actinoplanes sp. N902-109]|nr:hypothetical protein L083_2523 [Actinoplanes sp. N902-109]
MKRDAIHPAATVQQQHPESGDHCTEHETVPPASSSPPPR